MPEIIDVSYACGSMAAEIAQAGVRTVVRYYSRNTRLPAKRLTQTEALELTGAGLKLAAVHEARRGDLIDSFDEPLGRQDGAYAFQYAAQNIGQLSGSAIYFAVDLDPSAAQITAAVLPYFKGVAAAAANSGGAYRIGVYGSGRTCAAVLDHGLAELAWLGQAKGWAEYKAFLASKRWALLQDMPATVAGVDCDPDAAGPDYPNYGAFTLLERPTPVSTAGLAMRVTARDGLHLRAGPGLEYTTLKLLPYGTLVFGSRVVSNWTLVDLQGDGAADGFVHRHYLEPASATQPALTLT